MWRKIVLVLGVLNFPIYSLACGDKAPPAAAVQPAEGSDFIKKTELVRIRGKLTSVRCLMFGRTSTGIVADGKTYWLDLRGNKHFHSLVAQAGAGPVVVAGNLERIGDELLVNVSELRIEKDEYVQSTLNVELQGTLKLDHRDILRPFGVAWYVTVDGHEYFLHFGSKQDMAALAKQLDGRRIKVTGAMKATGRWSIVDVDQLTEVVENRVIGCGLPVPSK